MQQLILELKENNEDYQFYPTAKEMIRPIYARLDSNMDILDIGCGTCNLRKFIKEFDEEKNQKYLNDIDLFNKKLIERYPDRPNTWHGKYFVIEKSQILINKLDKNVIVLGTDFYNTLLIDKKADVYFCNPPYSEFEEWTIEILKNGNYKKAYLIIPERWKNNERINTTIKNFNIKFNILGSYDFLNAERQARAKVELIEFDKRNETSYGYYKNLEDFETTAFDSWFDETFKMRNSENDNKYEYQIEKDEIQKIKNELVSCKSKGDYLVNSYNAEQKKLFEHFKAICSLDVNTLETIGVKKEAIKEAIKQKIKSLKTRYWKIVFDEFEEITSRLTSETREEMFNRFQELQTVDFTLENIYPLILWVIKNANSYYNDQLINFFRKLTSPENVKPYKSNQKAFEEENWGGNRHFKQRDKISHYTLDYRIIMSSPFRTDYRGNLDGFDYGHKRSLLQNIFTIARNLGFNTPNQSEVFIPNTFGEKMTVYYRHSDKIFMEYRVYKNGNMHVKFDIEFAKAMNITVSKLLGWIRTKEDVKKEFPENMVKNIEKYFNINMSIGLDNSSFKLLGIINKID